MKTSRFASCSRWVLLLITALLLGCAARITSDPVADPEFALDRVKQRFAVSSQVVRLRIENRHGDVYLKPMHGPDVGIYAVVQTLKQGAGAPRFAFSSEADSASLQVSYPIGADAGRVDLTVFLPELDQVEVVTDSGRVRAKEMTADLLVATRTGDILVSSSGRLQLHTAAGAIRATQIGGKWIGAAELVSESGLVELLIPPSSAVRLTASSSGTLTEEFGAALKIVHRDGNHLVAELGSDPNKLNLRLRAGGELLLRPFFAL